MWNNLEIPQRITALQSFAACLRDKTMFGIMTVTTGLVKDLDEADKLFNDLKFIQDEGYSLGMLEVSLSSQLKTYTYEN